MSSLPTGTVTFLFTDIEGSTRLWEEHPEAMKAALARHDQILRSAIGDHDGYVFSTAGDAFSAAFHRAPDAISGALEAQQGLVAEDWGDLAIEVRMALHTGEADEREGDYFGSAVNRAARLLSAGHGGQVLLTQAAHDQLGDSPPSDLAFEQLGEHRLRDLASSEHVFQAVHTDLPSGFPPLRSLGRFVHNLPVQLTSFIGRTDEIATIEKFLADTRHATLVGPGGCGKTRLALQVAADTIERHEDGAWFVDLRQLDDPSEVASLVAATLRVVVAGERPVHDQIIDALLHRELLLILDNCEHVLEEIATLVEPLLRHQGKVHLLATSREPLGLPGESLLGVQPLPLPKTPELDELLACEAAQLFVDRASSARSDFSIDQHVESVFEICRSLDGLPLGLELAATRLRAVSPEELASRLDDHLGLLKSSQKAGDLRHATMEATIEWSWGLLNESEQTLFGRLSVFPATWSLGAAEVICGFDPLDRDQVLDLVASLVDKSLVVLDEESTGGIRYRILEPIRQFGAGKLDSEVAIRLRSRHVDHWASSLAPLDDDLRRANVERLEQARALEPDRANLTAAVEWALDSGRFEDAMRIVGSLFGGLLIVGGSASELVSGWMKRALPHTDSISVPVLLHALNAACGVASSAFRNDEWLSYSQLGVELSRTTGERESFQLDGAVALNRLGRRDEAYRIFDSLLRESDDPGLRASTLIARAQFETGERAWELVRQAMDLAPLDSLWYDESVAAFFIGEAALGSGRYDIAATMAERCLDLSGRSGYLVLEGHATAQLAGVRADQGRLDEASDLIEQAIPVVRRILGPNAATGHVLLAAADISRLQGDLDQARSYADEAEEAAERNRVPGQEVWAAIQRGLIARDAGDLEEAQQAIAGGAQRLEDLGRFELVPWIGFAQASVALRRDEPDRTLSLLKEVLGEADLLPRSDLVEALDAVAVALAQTDRPTEAAAVLAAAERQRDDIGLVIPPPDLALRDRALNMARLLLGDNWEVASNAGRAMTLDEAVAYALNQLDD